MHDYVMLKPKERRPVEILEEIDRIIREDQPNAVTL